MESVESRYSNSNRENLADGRKELTMKCKEGLVKCCLLYLFLHLGYLGVVYFSIEHECSQ